MQVRVKILRPLADLAGATEARIQMDGSDRTFRALIQEVARQFPKLGEEIYPDGKDIGFAFAAIRNDVLMSAEEYDRELREGDEVTLFAPITGGS